MGILGLLLDLLFVAMVANTPHDVAQEDLQRLRDHGLASLGIGLIQLYQNTVSQVTPARCRFSPSCSQYGIDAISEWGLLEGIRLTRERISRCHRPNGGYDPVPLQSQPFFAIRKTQKVTLNKVNQAVFKPISQRQDLFIDYNHRFRLILAYPKNREFLSQEDFKYKIAEFNRLFFEIPNYALCYKVNEVEVGIIDDYYLLRLKGSLNESLLETKIDQIIDCLAIQLSTFFIAARKKEFLPLYFEVDGQVYLQPEPETVAVPKSYSSGDFWNFTSDPYVWDVYWDTYLIESLLDLLDGVGGGISDAADSSDGCDVDGCGDGGEPSGCDMDGCGGDGCELDGCGGDGCDLGGCDGCDFG